MYPLKIILYIFGILILFSEVYVYFFYYFNLYPLEFMTLRWGLHFSTFVIVNGILYSSEFKNYSKNLKITATVFFSLEVLMLVYNYKRNEKDLRVNGLFTTGYVVDKYKASKGSWDVVYNFKLGNCTFKSELSISERSELDKIGIGDSAKIKYSFIHPKINRVIKKY